jgi:LCP family protein required for cell wall assembly
VTLPIPTAVPRQPIPDEALTIVLLGSDQRPDWDYWNTDVIQYVVVYPDIPSVAMLSIPRDLYVFVPNFWMTRINRADLYGERYQYDGGGLGLLNQTLLYNLGISADYYVKVNFDGLIGLVNAMGGIEVPVYCPLSDYWPYPNEAGEYYRITLTPGIHEMDGELALWYSRSRKTTSVFARERRQQQVLEAMWHKAKGANMLASAPALYEQTHHLFQTDLELGQMLVLAMTAAKLDAVDVRRYNIGWGEVTPYTTIHGGNVFLPIGEKIQPIIEDVLARPAASRAFRAANRVEVWNRTGHPEWDLVAADQLYHYGYIPITGGTPDHNVQPQTQVMFFGSTLKGSGITWLQSLFNVGQENVIHQEDPRADVKLRLILGQDYDPCR